MDPRIFECFDGLTGTLQDAQEDTTNLKMVTQKKSQQNFWLRFY